MLNLPTLLVAVVVTLISFADSVDMIAQRSPNRGLNMGAARRWRNICEDTLRMFQLSSPYLTSLPPLQTNMPLDVLIAYIGADSIARTVEYPAFAAFRNSITTFNDTLKQFGKYLYRAVDWNPLLFEQYSDETLLNKAGFTTANLYIVDSAGNKVDTLPGSTIGPYKVTLPSNISRIAELYLRLRPDSITRDCIAGLLISDYVMRVVVDSVDSCLNYLSSEEGDYRYAVYARVLDTLKGRVFPNLCHNANRYLMPHGSQIGVKHAYEQPQESAGACNRIRFEYWKGAYWSGKHMIAGARNFHRDTAFLDSDYHFIMRPGTECIVFLKFRNYLQDDNYDYYNLDVATHLSFGVLRVSDGFVIDLNRAWSPTNLTVAQFNQRFEALVHWVTQP